MTLILSAADLALLNAGKPVALQPPSVAPPIPPPVLSSVVYAAGVFHWAGDYSWPSPQVSINYANTAILPGSTVIGVSCSTPECGFQPYAPNLTFNTTGFTHLEFDLIPTKLPALWDSGFQTKGVDGKAAETPIGVLTNIMPFGPPTIVAGARNRFKIPLGVGGYQIPVGATIYKFMIQDQSGIVPYLCGVDNIEFT
jgi:hypothetical protein